MKNIEKIKELVKDIQNLFLKKNYPTIIEETKKAINNYPNISIFYNLLGLALSQIGKLDEAKVILEKGYQINSNDLAIINNLANVKKGLLEFNESENLYKLSISKKKDYFNAYVNYGNLKRELNKFDEAISLYKEALKYNNKLPAIYYSLSMSYQSLGHFKEAENYAIKALELNKRFTRADLLISRSKKYQNNDKHFNQMKEKINDKDLHSQEKIDLYFALSKAYEDLGKIEDCFNLLKEGNNLKRDNVNFNLKFEESTFEDIKSIFSKINFTKIKEIKSNEKKIIFILGMPRSGTTLVEQIISAHSNVYGSGELPYLTKIINKKFIENKKTFSY